MTRWEKARKNQVIFAESFANIAIIQRITDEFMELLAKDRTKNAERLSKVMKKKQKPTAYMRPRFLTQPTSSRRTNPILS